MSELLNKVSEYASKIITEKLPKEIVYHNIEHTKEVVDTANDIGKHSGLPESEMEILLIAAWFHDIGITGNYNNHEEKSASIAKDFLQKNNYPSEKIEKVINLILATRLPQEPKNLIEKVICDADISHIGKKEFNTRSQLLRKEWENTLGKKTNDKEWLKNNIDFLSHSKFHTKYAKENFEKQRLKNLAILEKRMKKEIKENLY
jgi:uncharacterized protein